MAENRLADSAVASPLQVDAVGSIRHPVNLLSSHLFSAEARKAHNLPTLNPGISPFLAIRWSVLG